MNRDVWQLSNRVFDLVVIGGGIYGACVAWDATLRGLSVALIEQEDFGHATSANSQKTVHGGLRYLKDFDIRRLRESVQERKILMRIAPHLVHPLPFIIPTYRSGMQNQRLMRMALTLYDLIAFDRNLRVKDPQKKIPNGRVVPREECLGLAPGLDKTDVTGGCVWYDAQIHNSERLTLAFIRSASEQGACVANYLKVIDLLHEGTQVTGVRVRDVLNIGTYDVQGRLVINTSGPWLNGLLDLMPKVPAHREIQFSKAISIVTKPVVNDHAVSVLLPGGLGYGGGSVADRRLYLTPWRGRTIAGCEYFHSNGDVDACRASEEEVGQLVADVNAAYPKAALRQEDVSFVHVGFLPRLQAHSDANPEKLAEHYQIIDHKQADGVDGFISVVGVKYTTARDVAEKTVTMALEQLGRLPTLSHSKETPVSGGRIERFNAFLLRVLRRLPYGLDEETMRQLVYNYGSDYSQVLKLTELDSAWRERLSESVPILKAQVVYAVREEMAKTLRDVVFRRTELGTLGYPGYACLSSCANLMAEELGWDRMRIERELDETEQAFIRHGARVEAMGVEATQ